MSENIEQEYIDSKIDYESLMIINTPNDPIESAKLSIRYKKAQQRYFEADRKLRSLLSNRIDWRQQSARLGV